MEIVDHNPALRETWNAQVAISEGLSQACQQCLQQYWASADGAIVVGLPDISVAVVHGGQVRWFVPSAFEKYWWRSLLKSHKTVFGNRYDWKHIANLCGLESSEIKAKLVHTSGIFQPSRMTLSDIVSV